MPDLLLNMPNWEVGQGPDQTRFANPNACMSAMGCWFATSIFTAWNIQDNLRQNWTGHRENYGRHPVHNCHVQNFVREHSYCFLFILLFSVFPHCFLFFLTVSCFFFFIAFCFSYCFLLFLLFSVVFFLFSVALTVFCFSFILRMKLVKIATGEMFSICRSTPVLFKVKFIELMKYLNILQLHVLSWWKHFMYLFYSKLY